MQLDCSHVGAKVFLEALKDQTLLKLTMAATYCLCQIIAFFQQRHFLSLC